MEPREPEEGVINQEFRDMLWDKAVREEVACLDAINKSHHGTSLTCLGFSDNDTMVVAEYKSGRADGTSVIHTITCKIVPVCSTATFSKIDVRTNTTSIVDSHDEFWQEKVAWADPMHKYYSICVRVNHEHYCIEEEGIGTYGFKGHGGRKFHIKFFDGREVITDNLWYQGVIPPKYRELLPDNAEFVPQEPFRLE